MAYIDSDNKLNSSLIKRFINKVGKLIAQKFPLNSIRRSGLRLCGFSVGKNVYIGPELIVASILTDNTCNLAIKDRVAIGPRVTIVLSSDANWSKLSKTIIPTRSTVILDEDCWIGAGAILLPGVTIGKMSIVGAGSVVTKDVPPYSVYAGVPAKFIKKSVEE